MGDLETELGVLLEKHIERIGLAPVIDALDFYVVQLENRNELEATDLRRLRALPFPTQAVRRPKPAS